MRLALPTYADYKSSAHEVKSFFGTHNTDYCIYWSFLDSEKLRPGLSDIDIFLIHPTEEPIFPLGIIQAFWMVKDRISELWIPLQMNLTTRWQLGNGFLSPDGNYLFEVRKWLRTGHASERFWEILSQTKTRDWDEDDRNMARYFHRKIVLLGAWVHDIAQILEKNEQELTKEDGQKIWQLWDSFKKIITFIWAVLRIKTGVSPFWLKDRELLERFALEFDCKDIPFEEFVGILEWTKNIHDWYGFLRQGWLERIASIYDGTFSKILLAAWSKL